MNKLAVTPFAQDSQTHGSAPGRQQLLQQLAQLWQQGATEACFSIARQLTSEFPKEGIAWKILGGLLQQRGDLQGAGEALAQAVKLLKKDAEVFLNAANVAAQLGDVTLATKHYRQAIRLNPSMTRAYANLASLLKEAGQQKEAEKLLRTALQLNKRDALVLFDLAALLHESGKSLEAVQYYRQALEIEPDNAVLAYNMAQVLFVLGNLDEALVHFQSAIDLNPTYFDALHQYGHCLRQKNRFKEAEQVWLQARVLNPESWQLLNDLAQLYKQLQQPLEYEACAKAIMQVKAPEIEELNNFTSTLINQQLLTEAERYCKQAMSLGIEDPFTYCNMALLLYYKQEYAQSLEYYEKALQLKPDCAAFWSNYSVSLRLVGEVERARQALEKAIALDPEYLDSYINLGSAYLEQGDVKLAVETYVKLISRAPHLDKAYRNLLYTNSFANELSPKEHLKYARACGEQFMAKAAPFKNWLVNAQDQRLRIGLVSADLRSHPVGYFLEHWLKHIDAGKTEIYAYSADGREDNYSQVLKKHCTQWRSLAGMNDARAASLIREDGIHILLDLSGYTADSRVSLFAWRPAPVQASWLGYWDTTGLPTMDAVIADPVSVPAGSEGQFTESVVKLPHTRLCFSAPDSNEQVNALPALQNGYVTFGCFQKYSKVSDEVLAVWAQVFLALPEAKLYWQCKAFQDDQIQAEALARLQQAGIQPEQCVLMRPTARDAYFKNYHAVDMILDSFPFNGGTTTCEALWMGVPTLTMPGETMISRQGASMMTSAGLPEWVAEDKKAFVQKAIQFAADLPALANLRAGLRAQVMRSPLMDGERFARDMEQLLWNVWSERVTGIADALLAKTRIQDAYAGEDPVWIISATRASEEAFWASSALGVSLKRHMQQDARIVPYVYYENTRGLSEVFNEAVAIAPDNALVIFAHDDIWLDQNPFVQTVMDGLAANDVIGVAGTARMLPKQPAWLFTDLAFTWEQSAFLRGKVAHSEHPFGHNTYFGAEQGDCVLMDGVFMAAYKRTLTQANVRHDPQFDFEFYDLDFCRTATQAGLKLGIWPISLTHQSMGNFGKQRWRDKYQMYLRKWGEGEAAVGTPMTAELGAALEEVFTLALQHQQAGDLQTATQLYQEILAVAPQSAPAWFNLGLIAWAQGHQQEAVACFAQAHAAQPAEWEYLQHYLVAMHATASADTLAATFEQALALPQHAEAVHQLAEALKMPAFTRQSVQHAQASSQDAAMQPDAAQQQALLTAFEQQQYGQMEQALHTYLGQYPQWLAGWKMLADVLMLQKKDASAAAKQALVLNAQDPQEHCYYGIVLKAKGDLPGAATAFQQAIALKSDYAAAYNNLGTVLKDLGQVETAIEHFKCALALQPNYADCFSNLLFCMTHAEHIDNAALMQAHQAYADLYEAPLKAAWLPHQNTRDVHRPLNIGWVSADFRAHSVAHFMLPLLSELAKETSLRLVAYANQPLVDNVTTQMQDYFSTWYEVSSWSDQALAEQIRADGIDILIDLSGHTSGNRLLAFARKPAPVQVSWLGYLNTTGLSSMDYYLADSYLLPPGQFDDQFTEKLVQLPVNATFIPFEQAPEVNALPALSNGYVTFGCFNRVLKITQATVQQWAALMQALPDSRLVIGGVGEGESTQHLQTWFAEAGIAANRIRYYARTDMASYLGYYHEVDICLDTFPSNGVTTTAHALWMGVPTLCVAGDRLASRGAMALMQHLGLMQFIAKDNDSLVKQAMAVCADLAGLANCRANMRQHFSESLLAKPDLQAEAFSKVLRLMWQHWCIYQQITPTQSRQVDASLSNPTLYVESEMHIEELEVAETVNTISPLTVSQKMLADAKQLEAAGETTQAKALYLKLLEAEPNDAEANFQLGWIETHTRGVAFALPRFETAVLSRPDIEQYWVSLIDAYILSGDFSAAHQAIEAGQASALSSAMAQTLLQELNETFLNPALSHQNSDRQTLQVLQYERTDSRSLIHSTDAQSNTANEMMNAAKTLQAEGEFEKAAVLYHKVMKLEPKHAEANHQLGFIMAHLDCVETALPLFENAVMFAPMQEQYWVSYIDALIMLKDFTTSSQAIEQGVNFGLSLAYAETLQNEMKQAILDTATPQTVGSSATLVLPIATVEQTAAKFDAACLLTEVSIDIPPIPIFGSACPNPYVSQAYTITHPPVYEAEVSDYAFIGGAAFPMIDHSCVLHQYFDLNIWETREQSLGFCQIYPNIQLIVYKNIQIEQPQEDCVIPLMGNGSDNYAHWLTEYLPQIVLLKNAGVDLSKYKVLIDDQSYPAMEEGLNLLGIDSINIHRTTREVLSRYTSARWVSPVANVAFQRPKALQGNTDQFLSEVHHSVFHPEALRAVRTAFSEKVDANLFAHLPEKIFIKRVPGRDFNARVVVNEAALEALLIANGFTVVEPGAWSFLEQVTLFSQAKYIVSASGAALLNMMWAPEGANIVVLMNDTPYANYWYFANIATAFGHKLSYVLGDALKSDRCTDLHHSDFEIDSHALLQALASMGMQDIIDPTQQPTKVAERLMAFVSTEGQANFKQTVRLLKELIKLQPDNAQAHYQLASTLVKLTDRATAALHFEQAAKLSSTQQDYWLSWIDCLIHMHAYTEAEAALEASLAAGVPADSIENFRHKVTMHSKTSVLKTEPSLKIVTLDQHCDERTTALPVKTIVTLIPAYKSTYIEQLLFALRTQTYKDFKVVISDDSPDGSVSQKVNQLRKHPQYHHLNIELVDGPKQGGFVNIYHLVRTYAAQADLFHILMDDDVIFPTFYETHIRAHQKQFSNLSISGRWYANEQGQPCLQAMDFQTSQVFTQDFSARQIAKQLIPSCNNKLGEWSHAVFRASAAEIILQPEMAGISYFGLDDIGSFIKAAITVPAIWIPESLGIFRLSAEQNTGKHNNATIKCAHYSWISLALAGLKNEWLTADEAWGAIHIITNTIRKRYATDPLGMQYLKETNRMTHEYHPEFEAKFLALWQTQLQSMQLDKILNGALDIKLL